MQLQIEFIHSSKCLWPWRARRFLLQDRPFHAGILITNIGDSIVPPGVSAQNIIIKSADGKDLMETADEIFDISGLAPKKEKVFWLSRKICLSIWGLATINLRINAPAGTTFNLHQKDGANNWSDLTKGTSSGAWLNFFYVRSRSENTQTIFNSLLFFIAIISIIATIWSSYYFPNKLWKQQNKEALTQNITKLGQNRIYGAQRFYFDIRDRENAATTGDAWNSYMRATIEWNEANILNPMFLESYFGDKEGRADYENQVIPLFTKLHEDLLSLRKNGATNKDINGEIENVRAAFNRFISKLLNI